MHPAAVTAILPISGEDDHLSGQRHFLASKLSTELFNHVWLHRDKSARNDWFGFDYFNHMAGGDIGGSYHALTDASSRDDCFI